jgi:2-polyprenyl-6-methoxyphenol hydroxylase-like FAD-dependent oxidoreductase
LYAHSCVALRLHADDNFTDKLSLGQMYARKIKIGLISLEKGVVKNRSRGGHMVLVSDAAHKFTPSRGAGYNDGIIDSLALANTPNRAFSSSVPSSDRLDAAFKDYRDMRYDAVTASQLRHFQQ